MAYGVVGLTSVNRGLLNVLRNPNDPFNGSSPVLFTNVAGINNTGTGARWKSFDPEVSTDIHRIITFVDPVTGMTRMIVGDDQGVGTGLGDAAGNLVTSLGSLPIPGNVRNGNLQTSSSTARRPSRGNWWRSWPGPALREGPGHGFPVGLDAILQQTAGRPRQRGRGR